MVAIGRPKITIIKMDPYIGRMNSLSLHLTMIFHEREAAYDWHFGNGSLTISRMQVVNTLIRDLMILIRELDSSVRMFQGVAVHFIVDQRDIDMELRR